MEAHSLEDQPSSGLTRPPDQLSETMVNSTSKRRKMKGIRYAQDRHKTTVTAQTAHRVFAINMRVPKTILRGEDTVPELMDAVPTLTEPGANTSSGEPVADPSDVETCQTPIPTDTKYMKNRRSKEDKWFSLRALITAAMVEERSPDTYYCCECNTGVELDDIIVCHDCGPQAYFCSKCCDKQHKHVTLHQPKQWKDGTWIMYELPATTWQRAGHACITQKYPKTVTLFDDKGYLHTQSIEFCSCEDKVVTLVRHGFWPTSPLTVTNAISIKLLIFLRSLLFEGKMSLTSFITSLKHRHEAQFKDLPNVYDIFTWDIILNFMVVYHDVTHLESICPGITQTQTCPACPEKLKTISMDGNFSLVRKHREGNHQGFRNRHQARFFLPQEEVDSFVADYDDNLVEQRDCSNFQAGSVVRSTKQSEKLEVKGVFGSVCRHDYPQKFFDMKHGERLAYPVYLLSKIKNETGLLLYDIACKLESHMKVKYSPRRIRGAGLCDGEGTERLWSYLGSFSNITKEMTSENRHDYLTELLIHYSMKLTNKMAKFLLAKLRKVWKSLQETDHELKELLVIFSGTVTDDTIEEWGQKEVQSIQRDTHQAQQPLTWKGTYALLLSQYYSLRDADVEREDEVSELQIERLEIRITKIEAKHNIQRWTRNGESHLAELEVACTQKATGLLESVRCEAIQYTFLQETRKKYRDGQALGIRITKQILASSQKLNAGIKKYNECAKMSRTIPTITRDKATKLDDCIQHLLVDEDPIDGQTVPRSMKRKAVDLLNRKNRAKEEMTLLTMDMTQLHTSVTNRQSSILERLDEFAEKDCLTRYDMGCISSLRDALNDMGEIQNYLETYCAGVLLHGPIDMSKFMEFVKATDIEREKSKDDSHPDDEERHEESDEGHHEEPDEARDEESDEEEENDEVHTEDDDWIGDPPEH